MAADTGGARTTGVEAVRRFDQDLGGDKRDHRPPLRACPSAQPLHHAGALPGATWA